ncbi:molybdopterin cofactor-binding domain-containing protein [Algirhabdus cladophorae]|uniref:xanthine dehydrogenase family protein molybdopterin-binding subunit n=1 Tax=Algirhabdus cladophorae TaxID=3377108 RepID=UPI003B847079
MSKLGTIARRTFLIGSVAVAGGVAFGAYAYKRPVKNPLLADLKDGQAALTPYVKIDSSGVTLITPRTDLGQGAYSVQAALIAEELDVELDQIKVDPGVPSPAYYNTAMAEEAAPFRSTDKSGMAEAARTGMDALLKFMGLQVTGGSTTVPDSFEKLRMAGAVARETLKQAAAEASGLAVDVLKTQNGEVLLPDGTTLAYTALAARAAGIAPVTDVTLRDPSQWRLIGKPQMRVDTVAKSTGTLEYGIDMRMEGMVNATVKLNPAQGAGINSFDASAAEAMDGVIKVVPVTGGVGVVAKNTWTAFQAAEALDVDWAASDMPATMDGHWGVLADAFVEDQFDSRLREEGDVIAAQEDSDVFIAEYRAPYLAHAPLEPISAIVKVEDARVDVWTSTQIPRFVQTNISALTGVDYDNVHVHVLMCGGSFGHRLEDEVVKQAAEIAMEMKGTPVKLTYSREEDLTHDFTRQIAMARGAGVVRDGRVESFDLGISMPSVIASQMGRQGQNVPGPDTQIVAGAWEQPFAIPNYRVTGYRAKPLAPLSSWRSVGASTNAFFHDVFLDELIHEAGADPMQERLRLMWHDDSRKVMEAVAEMSNWGSPMGENQGRGVAFCMSFGVAVAEVVEVTNTDNGIKIDNVYVAAEVGTVVDPINFENLVQGGVVWGLGHAMNCEITYTNGIADQTNYHAFEGMRMYQCPQIQVRGLENSGQVRGIGEPPVPPAAAALSNAIFDATGQRIREMPFNKHIDFV